MNIFQKATTIALVIMTLERIVGTTTSGKKGCPSHGEVAPDEVDDLIDALGAVEERAWRLVSSTSVGSLLETHESLQLREGALARLDLRHESVALELDVSPGFGGGAQRVADEVHHADRIDTDPDTLPAFILFGAEPPRAL